MNLILTGQFSYRFVAFSRRQGDFRLELGTVVTSFVLHNLSPETVIVSGDKSTLIMRPVFGEYYISNGVKTCCGRTKYRSSAYGRIS